MQIIQHTSYIALGGNMGSVKEAFREALMLITAFGHKVNKVSPFYRSKPWGKTDQPDFWNGVAEILHSNSPRALLDQMQHIEQQLGRAAIHELNGPRPIDLDLLCCDKLILNTKTLTLPHPRMTTRPFVMIPLADIAPDLTIPGIDGTAAELADRLKNSSAPGCIINIAD